MIRFKKDRPVKRVEGIRGGNGTAQIEKLLLPEETDGHLSLFNLITLQPGASIGVHTHTADGEAYLVTEGTLTFIENGVATELHPGDITYTHHGDTHSMENRSDKPGVMLAVVARYD